MSNKYPILFLSIFSIILASGCTLPSITPFNSDTPPGTGVIVEEFGPDFQNVNSGETVAFKLKVKNTGSVTAENGFAELLGLDQVWRRAAGTTSNPTGENFPDENYCRYTTRQIRLLPEDTNAGITGGETTCSWRYIAPEVLPGLSITANPRVRFYYTYKSTTIKTVTLVSKDELKTLQDQGKSLPTEAYSKTNSPISIEMEATTPIRTYSSSVEFPIVITVKNVGGGTVCLEESTNCKKEGGLMTNPDLYKLKLNIVLPIGFQPAQGSCGTTEDILLVGGDPQTISCKIIADTSQYVGLVQKNIELNAKYGYFIDKASEVYVKPSTMPG
jgi:hypothetical protein